MVKLVILLILSSSSSYSNSLHNCSTKLWKYEVVFNKLFEDNNLETPKSFAPFSTTSTSVEPLLASTGTYSIKKALTTTTRSAKTLAAALYRLFKSIKSMTNLFNQASIGEGLQLSQFIEDLEVLNPEKTISKTKVITIINAIADSTEEKPSMYHAADFCKEKNPDKVPSYTEFFVKFSRDI